MTYEATRDAIKARLQTVPNIGVVQDYRRGIKAFDDFKTTYMATIGSVQEIRAWSIAWESGGYEPDAWAGTGGMRMSGQHVYVVRGYMSQRDDDATDKTFSALIRQVMRALATCMANATLRQSHVPVNLRSNDFLMFDVPKMGTALIHACEIEVRVMDEEVV